MQRHRSLYSCLIAFLVCFSFFNQPVQPVAAGSGSSSWGSGHGLPGVNGKVTAIVYDNGKTYVAGDFTTAGGSFANHIAVWDGTRWQGLATGATGTINALALDDSGNLYAGGNFTQIDGVTANDLAVRSPSTGQWSEFGGGVQGSDGVKALRYDSANSRLYVGGSLYTFGANYFNGIAYWDFTAGQWTRMIDGSTGTVQAIEIANGTVFIGGSFTSIGNVSAINVASYNTQSGWSAMGPGLGNPNSIPVTQSVYALKYFNGSLYAGGYFTTSGSTALRDIARWDGASWNDVGGGLSGWVKALGAAEGKLYAAGSFSTAGNPEISANNIAAWDGMTWSGGSAAINGSGGFQAMAVYPVTSNEVTEVHFMVGGSFNDINNTEAANIAGLTPAGVNILQDTAGPGTAFNGLSSEIKAIARDANGTLYAATCDSSLRVLRLDGTQWTLVGDRFPGGCNPLQSMGLAVGPQNQLYFAGTYLDGNMEPYVWQFDGADWIKLGGYFNGPVSALAVKPDGTLYAGGAFNKIDAVSISAVAKWDGASWSQVGSGIINGVGTLAISPVTGNLYAAGSFTQTGDGAVNYIAMFDTSWHPLGSGTNNAIYDMVIDQQDRVYVAGRFTNAGGQSAQRIAYYDTKGAAWHSMGSGANTYVNALGIDRLGRVYAGGPFTQIGGQNAAYLARWDGSTWSALDGGMASLRADPLKGQNVINAMLPNPSGGMYIAGDFYQAGDTVSNNIATFGFNNKLTFIPIITK